MRNTRDIHLGYKYTPPLTYHIHLNDRKHFSSHSRERTIKIHPQTPEILTLDQIVTSSETSFTLYDLEVEKLL